MLNMKVWTATLATWMGVSFTICVLGGMLMPGLPIRHQTLELLLPGFTWISLGSFVLGLAESLLYGVCAAAVLVVVHKTSFIGDGWGLTRRSKEKQEHA